MLMEKQSADLKPIIDLVFVLLAEEPNLFASTSLVAATAARDSRRGVTMAHFTHAERDVLAFDDGERREARRGGLRDDDGHSDDDDDYGTYDNPAGHFCFAPPPQPFAGPSWAASASTAMGNVWSAAASGAPAAEVSVRPETSSVGGVSPLHAPKRKRVKTDATRLKRVNMCQTP